MTDPMIGRILDGKIRIDSLLGAGAMGRVYGGSHLPLSRPVAVKVMTFERAIDRSAVLRFERESRAMSAVEHPHVVSVFDFGSDPEDGLLFLVMERVVGHTLDEELLRVGRIPLARAVRILSGVLDALQALHDRGIVHRDLKPANIMLVPSRGPDFAKVCDFGIAKLLHSDELTLTRTGGLLGTPAYMAPEQASAGDVGPAADLYAVGVMLFEILTGRKPFVAHNMFGMLAKHVEEPAPPPGVDRRIDAVVLRLLAKAPGDRFRDAAEARDALQPRSWRRRLFPRLTPKLRSWLFPRLAPKLWFTLLLAAVAVAVWLHVQELLDQLLG